ncbi:MAG TPA: DUF3108 domain-containing protein [Xanthomonadaceae bacterium]|nr:DUF3108 domain-containing protein [Xanthomonadaceae bacterium]
MALFLLMAASPVLAAPGLAPYRAHYEVLVDGKPQGSTRVLLSRVADDRWRLLLDADSTAGMARLAGYRSEQLSDFELRGERLRLVRSVVRNGMRLGTREVVTEFDWEQGQARWSGDVDADRRGPMPLPAHAVTRESLNLLLGYEAAGAEPGQALHYELLDRGRSRSVEYRVRPVQTIQVPAGRFEAVPLTERRADRERTTTAWFAPGLPPMPVRVLRSEGGRDRFEMRLLSWSRG